MTRLHVCALVLLAATATAQTRPTTPIQNFDTEGVTTSHALRNPGYQLVYRGIQSYSTLYLRPDSGPASYPLPAVSRHLTVSMSGAGVPSPELASTSSFASNRGSDYTRVLDDRLIALPAVGQRPAPAPFVVAMPLDRPFPTGHVAHLLVEIETRPETVRPAPWDADAEFFHAADWTILTAVHGTGCPSGTFGFGAQHVTSGGRLGGDLVTTMSMARQPGQPPSHPAVAIVGTSLSHWGPLALPLPLDLFGAPGCSIYTNVAQSYPGVTGGGSAERFTLRLPVPRDFGLLGAQLHSQSFIVDPTANALGLRGSPVATFTFSSPPDPHRSLTLTSMTRGSDRPAVVSPNQALVLGVQ